MFNNIIRKLQGLYRRRSKGLYFILSLVVMISLALAYMVTVPGEREDTRYPVSDNRPGSGVNETAKLVIIRWMKEHSEMSEQVLSKVYSAAMNDVNADLVLAICMVESNFNPHVESERGAIGLMGIMPDVWLEELKSHGIVRGQDDLYTISSNINSGVYVLGRYLARTNSLREALSRYAGGDPAYAAKVLRRLREISRVRRSEYLSLLAAHRPRV